MDFEKLNVDSKNRVKVLLVDDRKENLFSLGSLLEDLNLEIYKAQSGTEALSYMVDHDFSLALLDVQMPEMDGFELAELMRGAEKTQSIPIMFITAASPQSGFVFKGYELGAVDFLYKPVNPQILKSKVKVFVEFALQKRQLLLAKEAAENANNLKSAFLANMSHEIRTPLGAVIGFAQLLDDDSLTKADRELYISTIQRNGQSLKHLIDDILDLSKVEAGHLEIEKEEFSVTELLEDVFTPLNSVAQAKNLTLVYEVDPNFPQQAISDSKRIRQILMNIIGNAIKFTEKGTVTVTTNVQQLDSGRSNLVFSVKDTGMGIAAEQKERLFKPFMQADNSVTRKFGGTGLGLALSRRLAHLLVGDLVLAESSIGRGSTFVATIQVENAKKEEEIKLFSKFSGAARQSDTNKSIEGARILVVEDSPDNQLLIEVMLKRHKVKLEFANNGEEGIQKAISSNFDIILMDIQMPIMDGYMAVKKLRERSYRGPIIALTAHAMNEEREKCLNAGCNDFLSKPIDLKQLVEKVSNYVKR